LDLRKRLGVSVSLDDVGLEPAQKHAITLREVGPTPAEGDATDPWQRSREPDYDLVLYIDLAKELVIEPEPAELALGQEVGDFGGASLRILTEMPDERMFMLVVLEGLREVGGDDTGGMDDSSGGLSTMPDLGVGDDLGRNDLCDRADHVVTEGVKVAKRVDLCHARMKRPDVPLG